jgi:hypothetical protein
MAPPPSAAACSSPDSTRRAWATQYSRSESPRPTWPSMSSARPYAVEGSSQPTSGSKCTVEATPPSPEGLNTPTGPCSLRSGPTVSSKSRRVEVAMTAPGASAMWSAISPDFPVRGPPTRRVTSSTGL